MGKKKKDKEIVLDSYTYKTVTLKLIKGDTPLSTTGIKGKDNYQHSVSSLGEKNIYNGHGGVRSIPLARLELTVNYYKGSLIDLTDDKGTFTVDIMHFIKRNLLRKNGDTIERITDKFVDEKLKVISGVTTSSFYFFKLGQLPPDVYHMLLQSITNMTDLKRSNNDYVIIGAATCDKIDETRGSNGEGTITLYNDEQYILPKKQICNARAGDRGELIYPDNQKLYTGFFFRPYHISIKFA